MKRLAIDIVILPPESVMDSIIAWNRLLCQERPNNIIQNKADTLPHISLAMGCMDERRWPEALRVLRRMPSRHGRLDLRLPQIKCVTTSSGDPVVTLDIQPSKELIRLHEDIIQSFKDLLANDATEEDLFDSPPIDPSAVAWINQYIPHQSLKNFWPHITVGFGSPPADFKPFNFSAERLAICHLGNHCTCRKVLAEVELSAV